MIGSKLYFRFSDEDGWEEKMTNLFNELKNLGIHPLSAPASMSSSLTLSSSFPALLPQTQQQASPSIKLMATWGTKEVDEWLSKCNLNKLIIIFQTHDIVGESLIELHHILLQNRAEYMSLMKEMGATIGVTLQLATNLKKYIAN